MSLFNFFKKKPEPLSYAEQVYIREENETRKILAEALGRPQIADYTVYTLANWTSQLVKNLRQELQEAQEEIRRLKKE